MDSSLAHPSPSPSPAPRTNSRSLQARGFGGGASPGPEAATLVAEEQLNATGNETLDEMMETLDSYKLPSDDETE